MLKIPDWLIYSLISTFLFGLWAFFSKLAIFHIDSKSVLVYQILGSLFVALFLLWTMGFKLQTQPWGIFYALLVGIFGMVATLFFTLALNDGKASIVVIITALYPVLAVLLAFFILKEPINFRQWVGIFLALVAMVLCSIE